MKPSDQPSTPAVADSADPLPAAPPSRLNLPNLLCAIRLAGSPLLVGLAVAEQPGLFLALLIVLLLTDWLDGKLAVAWHQQTTFGARLDSAADMAMYSALLFGAVWLKGEVVQKEWIWLVTAVASYGASVGAAWWKFGRAPSYHTRAAKSCWFFTSVATVALFADWSIWPLRLAAAAVTFTNLESMAITAILPRWQANVWSVLDAWQRRKRQSME